MHLSSEEIGNAFEDLQRRVRVHAQLRQRMPIRARIQETQNCLVMRTWEKALDTRDETLEARVE